MSERVKTGVAASLLVVAGSLGLSGCSKDGNVIPACPAGYPATPIERAAKIANVQGAYGAMQSGVAQLIAQERPDAAGRISKHTVPAAARPAVTDLFEKDVWGNFRTDNGAGNGNALDTLGAAFCKAETDGNGIYPSPLAAKVMAELGVAGVKVDLTPSFANQTVPKK